VKSIGVRELRQRASEYLRQVERGRTLQVTARGRPVALLVPAGQGGRRQQLTASGRLVPAAGDLLGLGRPLPPTPDVMLPSDVLARARDSER
jgi:prevent-host-death family protein